MSRFSAFYNRTLQSSDDLCLPVIYSDEAGFGLRFFTIPLPSWFSIQNEYQSVFF